MWSSLECLSECRTYSPRAGMIAPLKVLRKGSVNITQRRRDRRGAQRSQKRRPCKRGLAAAHGEKRGRKVTTMALTRDFKETIRARVKRDPGFRKALLREGIEKFLSGDVETGKIILRDYVNATAGFPKLAAHTKI